MNTLKTRLGTKLLTNVVATSILASSCLMAMTPVQAGTIEGTIEQDKLITINQGLPWKADIWRYEALLAIQKFGGQMVGRVVLDRHAEFNKVSLSLDAFSLMPVTLIFASQWGANNQGCFMEMLIQFAPPLEIGILSPQQVGAYLLPTKVEVIVGEGKVVTLEPLDRGTPEISVPIPYRFYHTGDEKYYSSYWYMARNPFTVTEAEAKLLKAAQPGNATARVTFAGGRTYRFPIGANTVRRWQDAYGYNPTCKPGGQREATALTSPGSPQPGTTTISPSGTPPTRSSPGPTPTGPNLSGVRPARFPTTAEFVALNQDVRTARSGTPGLTAAQQRSRQAYQQAWAKKNPPVARFIGAWRNGDRFVYIYPSTVRGRTCVVTRTPNGGTARVGTLLNKELRHGAGSLFWIDRADTLGSRDTGDGRLYPVFATVGNPTLDAETIENMTRYQCDLTLPS